MPEPSSTDRLLEEFLGFAGEFSVKSHYPGYKSAERSLVESEARLRAMFSAVPFGMYLIDGEGRFSMANEAFGANLVGHRLEEAPMPEQRKAALLESYAIAHEGRGDRRTLHEELDGRELWLLSITAPVTVDDDTRGVVGISVDISDRVGAEEALRRVIGSMAHELNTPIAAMVSASGTFLSMRDEAFGAFDAIRGLPAESAAWAMELSAVAAPQAPVARALRSSLAARLEAAGLPESRAFEAADHLCDLGRARPDERDLAMVLGEGGLDALQAAWRLGASLDSAEIVASAAHRAAEVVRYLSTYIALYRSELFETRRFKLRESVGRAMGRLRLPVGLSVRLDIPDDTVALGDPDSLEYVWENLIRNAAQAARALVDISAIVQGDRLRVSVTDDGPGVASTVLLFSDPVGSGPAEAGRGLGLDIAKRIIDTHGGSLAYDRGAGLSTFTVELPTKDGATSA